MKHRLPKNFEVYFPFVNRKTLITVIPTFTTLRSLTNGLLYPKLVNVSATGWELVSKDRFKRFAGDLGAGFKFKSSREFLDNQIELTFYYVNDIPKCSPITYYTNEELQVFQK